MYEAKAVYGSSIGKSLYEMPNYDTGKETKGLKDDRGKSRPLMKLEWPEEGIFDDGKQSNTLTGAAHPGCCKQ